MPAPRTWVSGELVTAALLNQEVRDALVALQAADAALALVWKEIVYQEKGWSTSVTATTAAAADAIITTGSVVCSGAPLMVEMYSPQMRGPASGFMYLSLWIDSTNVGNVGKLEGQYFNTGEWAMTAGVLVRRYTPTAGPHTFAWKAYVSGGAGLVVGDNGGAGVEVPQFIRVLQRG